MCALLIRRALALSSDSEFGLDFGDAAAKSAFDFRDGLGLTEVTGFIKVLQVGAQFVEEFAGKAETHRETILPQNRCSGEEISWG